MAEGAVPEDRASSKDDDLVLTAREFAEVYEVDTERAITEAKLQRWYAAMEAENAS